MDSLLTIILIGIVAGLVLSVLRPAPQPQIIYIQAEEPQQSGGLGCLPLIVVGFLVLLALGVIRF